MAKQTKAERLKAEAFAKWLDEQPAPAVGTPYDKSAHPSELLKRHGLGVSYYDADYPVLVPMNDEPKPIGGLEAISDEPRQHAPSPDYAIHDDDGEIDPPPVVGRTYLQQAHANALAAHTQVAPSPEAYERAEFVDRVAVLLFASGWPKATIYSHAASLWELRKTWRKEQGL